MELSRISTGITALDALLDGGFIKGRSYLLTGDTGTGKTIACLQFLVSVLAREEKAIYVTVDERPADILASAASFSWDLQPHIQGKSLVILDAASGSATEKGIDPQKMVADLSSYAKSLGASVLIIDPITPLLMPTNPAIPVQVHARSLIQLIQAHLNTTNLFTSHDARGREPHAVVGTEQFLATGVLGLKATGTNGRPERTLNIKKMRYTAVNPGEYPFALVQNEGIVLMNHQNGRETHSQEDLLQRDEPQFFKTFELGKKDS